MNVKIAQPFRICGCYQWNQAHIYLELPDLGNFESSPKQKGHETRGITEATLAEPAPPPLLHPPMGSWPGVTEGCHEVGHGCSLAVLLVTLAKPGCQLQGQGVTSTEGCQQATWARPACQAPWGQGHRSPFPLAAPESLQAFEHGLSFTCYLRIIFTYPPGSSLPLTSVHILEPCAIEPF